MVFCADSYLNLRLNASLYKGVNSTAKGVFVQTQDVCNLSAL